MFLRPCSFGALVMLSCTAAAQPGTLDPAFGPGSGQVITDFDPFGTDEARALHVLENGRILMAGVTGPDEEQDFLLARYLSNGTLDPDFGEGGRTIVSVSGGNDVACALTVQNDGRIIVVGYTYRPEGLSFAMIRFLENGDIDTGFGLNGHVVTGIGDGLTLQALAVAMQDDRILVAGGGVAGFALVRYANDGSIDATFGDEGLALCRFTNGNDQANGIGFQQDGSIIAAGYASGNADSIAVARFTANGVLDATFGVNGRARAAGPDGSAIGRALAVDAQDRIVVAGSTPLQSIIARFDAQGALDPAFNGSGVRVLDIPDADANNTYAVGIDADGHLLIAGSVLREQRDLLLARFDSDGSDADDFGVVTTSLGGRNAVARALAVQPDGRILLGGTLEFDAGNPAALLVRYNASDATHITDGLWRGEFQLAPNPASTAVTILPEHPGTRTYILCYDALGRNILSTDTRGGTTLDVSSWPSGAYMISTMNERGTALAVHRLLVQH